MQEQYWLWLRRGMQMIIVVAAYYGLIWCLLYAVKWRVDQELTTAVIQEGP